MTALCASDEGDRGLPQELYDAIIDFLHDDPVSLRCCALAHRRFLSASQKHIFNSLRLSTRKPLMDIPAAKFIFIDPIRLESILRQSPHLARFVLNLAVVSSLDETCLPVDEEKWQTQVKSLIFCLQQFRHLECFSVGPTWEPNSAWKDPEFAQAIQSVMALPSLHCLDYNFSYEMMASDLRTHIEYLAFNPDSRLRHAAPLNPSPVPTVRCSVDHLEICHMGMGAPLILVPQLLHNFDISNLNTLFVFSPSSLYLPTVMDGLLRACGKNLVHLVLDFVSFEGAHLSFLARRDQANLLNVHTKDTEGATYNLLNFTFKDLSALRKLHIKIQGKTFVTLLPDLVTLLATLPVGSTNALEDLFVQTSCTASEPEDHFPRPWDDLWDLVTDSSRFPRLTKLHLRTFYSSRSKAKQTAVKAEWKAHLFNKEFNSDKLRVSLDVLDHGDTFKELHPFWPNSGFDRLFSIC
ncbi:hypothetical protein CPC08DRAFT_821299 [Agrocybe pediades]|nr:hypothetical protein CPC08DRAFT_821299 [Agrocybe pediades]